MRSVLFFLMAFVICGCTKRNTSATAKKTSKPAVAQQNLVKVPPKKGKPFFKATQFTKIDAGSYVYPAGLKTKATKVTLTTPYLIKKTHVTQAEWSQLMGTKPSAHKNCPQCPVERVSWFDAVRYANRVSEHEGREPCYTKKGRPRTQSIYQCKGYRLPTEAEWVYVAQLDKNETVSDKNAWVSENSGQKTHPVGQKLANSQGLFDVQGNVWEWCHDIYAELPPGQVVDPQGPAKGKMHISRGGSWRSPMKDLSAFSPRYSHLPANKTPTRGFRLVRSAP